MSGVDQITQRILTDANQKAEANVVEAGKQADTILRNGDLQAEKQRQTILDQAKAEAADLVKRKQAICDLELRKNMLAAKREVMDDAFAEAEVAFSRLPDPEYRKIVEKLLTECAEAGDGKLVVAEKDKALFDGTLIARVQAALSEKGVHRTIEIERADPSIRAGFVYLADGLQIDSTFNAIIKQMRDRLEPGVSKILFND